MQEWNEDMPGISMIQTFVISLSMVYDISKYLSESQKRDDKHIPRINIFIKDMIVISLVYARISFSEKI